MKLVEILNKVDKKYKEEVKTVCDKWKKKVQEGLKDMMKFSMKQGTLIKFDITEAYPEELRSIYFTEEEYKRYKLYQHKFFLENIKQNLYQYPVVLEDVYKDDENLQDKIQPAVRIRKEVEKMLANVPTEDEMKNKLKNFNTDIFGIYKYTSGGKGFFNSNNMLFRNFDVGIELYWAVIGLFAERYNKNIEAITLTVLSHEYAHAYSHVGIDSNDRYWESGIFAETDKRIKEGIAEYYSKRFMYLHNDGMNRFAETYDFLLGMSPKVYQEFLNWKTPSYESLRYAMMEMRNRKKITEYDVFLNILEEGKDKYK